MKYCEFILNFVSGNPYVQTGMCGFPLITAADRVSDLLGKLDEHRNFVFAASAVLPQLIFFHLLMAQLFITGLTGLGAYFLLSIYYGKSLNSVAPPLIFILIISFAIAGIFTNLLAIVIATVTQDYAKCKYLHLWYFIVFSFLPRYIKFNSSIHFSCQMN